jgi:hypothetical protein
MREKVTLSDPAAALIRLLDALADDLVEASDEEIMQAAKDLGMNPQMKGSAVFAGLKYRAKPRLSDFYDLDLDTNLPTALKWWTRQLSKDADE